MYCRETNKLKKDKDKYSNDSPAISVKNIPETPVGARN